MADTQPQLPEQPTAAPAQGAPLKPLTAAEQRVEAAITQVKHEIQQLEFQLNVKRHHDLLHTYNMRKDATQIMIGKIATLERVTVAQISRKLGLDPTD